MRGGPDPPVNDGFAEVAILSGPRTPMSDAFPEAGARITKVTFAPKKRRPHPRSSYFIA